MTKEVATEAQKTKKAVASSPGWQDAKRGPCTYVLQLQLHCRQLLLFPFVLQMAE
jgi:hypothetical protein